ncbi:hypothetical protein [Streptomyces sp. NBC_00872]|uniref:hypothetical protein n=1 Tax=Streptomyces sp. NBC_00872 TaxID=2903686 RepID=UPI003869A938|nr:hypothetical protein OG214_22705 [Streptomyces sp. NBC_00872]
MGIESDQLVYDYLSRVGDAAQQRQLPSGDRMRLVSTLRNEIDRQRGKFGGDSPAAVRRILGRLGTPDAVVEAASSGGEDRRGGWGRTAAEPEEPRAAVPEQRKTEPVFTEQDLVLPEQRTGPQPAAFGEPDWWRIGLGPMDAGAGERGILAGIEIPEILEPPPEDPDEKKDGEGAEDKAAESSARGRWRALLRRGKAGKAGTTEKAPEEKKAPKAPKTEKAAVPKKGGLSNPFLLLAAALLVVGAFTGTWLALIGGWLLAYASRTLSRAEAKWAVFGLPGISAAGGLIWLWGRMDGRWGAPIPDTAMAEALADTWPPVLRTAAVTSALYLIWRARRR